ncbi:DUF427 domain-containing protein [Synechococcus sp. RSCCF101]|uniref:DUF427 domain-containing protein n=1 Tax=Synechococcus sp. RSCCF101 TaxID=2511069 RepID=UPI0012450447|nr:DUF427 domain-containing protein [Synechococcus sp. RSCCF101]QEY31026.1 DUF427 domain-containing protein [Synechococcus sp. RSCCF101]
MPTFVSDFPRPPALVRVEEHVRVEALGIVVAECRSCFQVRETFHPPTYYLPPESISEGVLVPATGGSFCEWKGVASYRDIVHGGRRLPRAAWTYLDPTPAFRELRGWVAFYAALMDACWVDGERALPQPGGFYGGWITSKVTGPFKGDPAHPELI